MKSMRLAGAFTACFFCLMPPVCAQHVTPHAPLLGSAWYPEQWPESRWEADLELMQAAHMDVVRVGEFAWSSLEPREGDYQLDWMARAIALAAKHHIRVVIGTPTDAPPAWLTTHYPETLGMDADGHWREHGGRRQFNYADPKYRELCREIVIRLGERFGHDPDVIGWQIDNEYTDESFDPFTRRQFQGFLRKRYGTLDNLNRHWATAYWSQTYTDWSQIPLEAAHGNPGLLLEHKHFVTATWRSFQCNQIDTLRPLIAQSQFITTNIGGLAWSDNWDHYAITADLDLASWDDYVGEGHLQVEHNAMLNDFVRGWKRENFWVMETQPGSVNWASINNSLSRGETRALAWQTVGHGADAVLYWQWRAALNGQEEYHGAIVGPDGTPLPLYPEIAQIGEDFQQTSPVLEDTAPESQMALLYTYDSRWAIDFQPQTVRYDQQKVLLSFYTPLHDLAEASGHEVDIVDPQQPGSLASYKLLVAPALNVLPQALSDKLLAWVRAGGHLVLGPRSGMKDAYDALDPHRQPGPLEQALGARVSQFYALQKPVPLEGAGVGAKADIWAEALEADSPDVRVDLRYGKTDGGWLDDHPAMVTREIGRGSLTYLGTLPDQQTMRLVLTQIAEAAHVDPVEFSLSSGVELCVRSAPNRTRSVFIFINHGAAAQTISLPRRLEPVLRGSAITHTAPSSTEFTLAPQGVAVLECTEPEKMP